jgi:phosphohistidine phosphatase
MEIYILRHGEAEPRTAEVEEAERKLTPKGRRDVERVMRAAQAAKVRPELALTSPYRRALETAQIAVRSLDPKPELVETPLLIPEGSPEQVWPAVLKALRSRSTPQEILLVGHEPLLSRLVAYLLATPSLRFDMKKGALVRISMERLGAEPVGVLKWVLTPSLVRTVGRES